MATCGRSLVWGLLVLLACRALGEEDLSFFIPRVPPSDEVDLVELVAAAKALKALSDESPSTRAGVAAAVATAVSLLPPSNLKKAVEWIKTVPAVAQPHLAAAVDLLASIREMGVAVPCLERPGAPYAPAGKHRYLIAANLFQDEALMPYWILEVLRLGLMLQGSPPVLNAFKRNATVADANWDPTTDPTVHISVYESGSTDNTALWLEVAEAVWASAGIRPFIVRNGSLTRTTLMDPLSGRFYKQHRIEYLASLRNAALEPLYNSARGTYDYVFYIQDVFFCAADLFRLPHLQADIACGLDFEVWIGEKKAVLPQPGRLRRRLLVATPSRSGTALRNGASGQQPQWQDAILHMVLVHNQEAARQAAASQRVHDATVKPRYEFFDTWISRDLGGNPFMKTEPIARDDRTVRALKFGLPIPAKCCWNGAALINASHLANGLRFRKGFVDDEECDVSDCSLLCEDYRRLGSKRVAVDPSVRVSYTGWALDFHGKLPGGIGPKVPWGHVESSGALADVKRHWSDTQGCMSIQCVPMDKNTEEAYLDRFKVINLDKVTNYTQLFLQRAGKSSPAPPRLSTCNLIMGPYGAYGDGHAFDDIAFASWGNNAITRISHRVATFLAPGAEGRTALSSIKATYGSVEAPEHGGGDAAAESVDLASGEFITNVVVYYGSTVVYGVQLSSNMKRTVDIGTFPSDVSKAIAVPCPADEAQKGRHRLIAFAGTSDKFVRSLTFIWG